MDIRLKRLVTLGVLILLCFTQSRAEGISLEAITGGRYWPQSAGYGFRPMVDGKSYTVISDDGTRLVQYSYETGKEVAVLFDTKKLGTATLILLATISSAIVGTISSFCGIGNRSTAVAQRMMLIITMCVEIG